MSHMDSHVLVKPIVPGPCKGETLVLDRYLSFFGEVDPETGCLRDEPSICIAGKVLVFRGSRGSTVGPYIMYALSRGGRKPLCMIAEDIEPMLIAGCVLGEIPLYKLLTKNYDLNKLAGREVEVVEQGDIYYIKWK